MILRAIKLRISVITKVDECYFLIGPKYLESPPQILWCDDIKLSAKTHILWHITLELSVLKFKNHRNLRTNGLFYITISPLLNVSDLTLLWHQVALICSHDVHLLFFYSSSSAISTIRSHQPQPLRMFQICSRPPHSLREATATAEIQLLLLNEKLIISGNGVLGLDW